MRNLTWFWVVAVATAFVCLLLTEKARPDDFADHVKQLEALNASRASAVRKEAPKSDGWKTGDRSFYRGKWWTLKADGWWYADPPPVQYEPPPVYYPPARAFRFFGGGSSCGPSG